MADTTVYFNPSCSKCQTAQGILHEHGVEADFVRYLDEPPTLVVSGDRAVIARPPERVLELFR